jgi:predicted nucleic acid-binding protein
MRAPTFIDTGYILALVNKRDRYHTTAQVASELVTPPFLTTEAVVIEIGNALSRQIWRSLGVVTLNQLRRSSELEIVSVDSSLLDRAIALYGARMDKEWGLTDCISFVAMQERGLTHVLTTDRHFGQAGFRNVLTDPQLSTRS